MTNPTIQFDWGSIEGISLALYRFQVIFWAAQQAQHDGIAYSDYRAYDQGE